MSHRIKLNLSYRCIYLLCLLAIVSACRGKKEDPSCYTQIIEELYYKVDSAGVSGYPYHSRNKVKCAGVCPDGTACDSLLELTVTSMGEPVRRVRCGCKSNPNPPACDIMLETIRHEGDTVMTYYKCVSYTNGCPVSTDQCRNHDHPGPSDTIRSVTSGRDSIIIKRKVFTCECKPAQ
jgi:hypothetical protein